MTLSPLRYLKPEIRLMAGIFTSYFRSENTLLKQWNVDVCDQLWVDFTISLSELYAPANNTTFTWFLFLEQHFLSETQIINS